MGKLTEITQWEDDIYQLETSDPVVGGPDGVSNKPQKQLANRTQWLKQQLESTSNALAEHAKSRNHPDASLTAKGFVQLYSGVMSDSEIMAATPKAVKIAMDNANARLAKERNLADLTNVPLARQSLQLGNSATLNVGTIPGTVAAGDDSRITGAMQKDQNGADILDKPKFIQNVGLKETLNPTKRVSIGNIGTGAFDGSTPSINIGDSDSGFVGSADGVIDIYCNNAKVGYIDNAGLHMLAGIATNSDVVLQSDARRHIIIQNADGSVRAYIYKDKDDTGIHINNGVDGAGDFVLGKDSVLYVPFAVRAGGSRKLAIQSDNNSALDATFNLWGRPERPTVIELDDGQGWHLYSQRNPDGSILFTVNGDIMANRKLNVGDATVSNDGNINGSVWGGWLNDWINNNLSRKNTASLETNGWFKDASTGLIIQWGITGGNLNKAAVNLPIPFPNAGLWSLGWVAGTLDMGNDDWSNSASLLNNSQLTVTTDHGWSTAWIAIGK